MIAKLSILAVLATAAAPAFAAGDATKGETVFRQCQTCHMVADDDGNVLAGRSSKTGPNLYGVIGRQAGTHPDFRYGDSIIAAGEGGLVWDEAALAQYVQDPVAFLRTTLNDRGAKSKMTFKIRGEAAAADVAAFLAQFGAPEASN